MKLKIFSKFISDVIKEGNRLQKHDIKGDIVQKRVLTDTQIIAIIVAVASLFILPKGFSENFAGFTISFLGIFVGLFSTIVISLHDKSKSLFDDYSKQDEKEKVRRKIIRNYMVQFTGLTSYSILLA